MLGRRHRPPRRVAALALLTLTTALTTALASPAAAVDLGVFSGPVRFEAPVGVTLRVGERRYVGTIEARVGGPGALTVLDELTMDAYLEGLAEVPVSWPEAALEAQVIAARTYAWRSYERGAYTDRGFDICATQACQVFAGRDVVEADSAGRWARAVAATTGLALVDGAGEPILARYSSSNGGASKPNIEVFPDDGDFPYLQTVDDPHDAVSPFHRWQVTFPRADFDAILARGETLAAAVPFADVTLVEVPRDEDLVRVTGKDGTVVDVTASVFRFFVSREAPEVNPGAYPPPRTDESGKRQPATLLSSQIAFTVTEDAVVVDGRGFGHAVGMGQYGALGKAEAGFTAAQILESYYTIAPTSEAGLPEHVRVGLAEDQSETAVTPGAPVVVRVGGTVLTERGLGTWRVTARSDRTLQIEAPEGYGSPLVVDPTSLDRPRPWPAEVVELETVVNKHVELEVEVTGADGVVVATAPIGIAGPGRHTISWRVGAAAVDGRLLPAGAYTVALVAIDEEGDRAGAGAALEVRASAVMPLVTALEEQVPHDPMTRPALVPLVVVLLAAVFVGGVGILLVDRRSRDAA